MPGAQVKRDDEYLSVQIPVPNPQKVTYISAIKGKFHDIRYISRSNSDLDGRVDTAKPPLATRQNQKQLITEPIEHDFQ